MTKEDTRILKQILKVQKENNKIQTSGFKELRKYILKWRQEDWDNHKREEQNFDRRKDKYDEIINLIKELNKIGGVKYGNEKKKG